MLSVFTKPWKSLPAEKLAELVAGFGFDAVEFPLREGFQVEPADAEISLPKLSGIMGTRGIKIASVASSTDENIFAACQAAGVPIIRIMLQMGAGSYMEAEDGWKKQLDALLPLCEKYGVKVAVQQHCGRGVFGSMELRHVLEALDTRYIGGIWDAAHSALAGEREEKALDILWDYLFMVNFKNAYQARVPSPAGAQAVFKPFFTTAKDGAGDWKNAVDYLTGRGYGGVVCMPAEYSDMENTGEYLKEDVKYLKSLFVGKADI